MKTVLITGISRGIGKALAQRFLTADFRVIGTSTTGRVDSTHANLQVIRLDLSDPKSIEHSAKTLTDLGIKIDIFINNAGILEDDGETKVIINKLRKTLEVNLIGTIDLTERIIPLIAENGHILNMSSMASSLNDTVATANLHYPYNYPAYKISKCALNMYTRTLAMRLAHEDSRHIIVSAVHPGWVKTDMGGDEAPISPADAAEHIFQLAISKPETGQFWFRNKKWMW